MIDKSSLRSARPHDASASTAPVDAPPATSSTGQVDAEHGLRRSAREKPQRAEGSTPLSPAPRSTLPAKSLVVARVKRGPPNPVAGPSARRQKLSIPAVPRSKNSDELMRDFLERFPGELLADVVRRLMFGQQLSQRGPNGELQYLFNAREKFYESDLALVAFMARAVITYARGPQRKVRGVVKYHPKSRPDVLDGHRHLAMTIVVCCEMSLSSRGASPRGYTFEDGMRMIPRLSKTASIQEDGEILFFSHDPRRLSNPDIRANFMRAGAVITMGGSAFEENNSNIFQLADRQSERSFGLNVMAHKLKTEWPAADDPMAVLTTLRDVLPRLEPAERARLIAHLYIAAAGMNLNPGGDLGIGFLPARRVMMDADMFIREFGAVAPKQSAALLATIALFGFRGTALHCLAQLRAAVDLMRSLPEVTEDPPLRESLVRRPDKAQLSHVRTNTLDLLSRNIQPYDHSQGNLDTPLKAIYELRDAYLDLMPRSQTYDFPPSTSQRVDPTVFPRRECHPLIMAFMGMPPNTPDLREAFGPLLGLLAHETGCQLPSLTQLAVFIPDIEGLPEASVRRFLARVCTSVAEPGVTAAALIAMANNLNNRWWKEIHPTELQLAMEAMRARLDEINRAPATSSTRAS